MTRWQRFRRLETAERYALIRAIVVLPVVSLTLRVLGFRRTQQILTWLTLRETASEGPLSEVMLMRAGIIARMVEAAGREVWPHARCLERSLTAWWLMRRRHVPARLRIGVRREGEGLRAHAWVEVSGVVLNDNEEIFRGYKAFARAIQSGSRQSS